MGLRSKCSRWFKIVSSRLEANSVVTSLKVPYIYVNIKQTAKKSFSQNFVNFVQSFNCGSSQVSCGCFRFSWLTWGEGSESAGSLEWLIMWEEFNILQWRTKLSILLSSTNSPAGVSSRGGSAPGSLVTRPGTLWWCRRSLWLLMKMFKVKL